MKDPRLLKEPLHQEKPLKQNNKLTFNLIFLAWIISCIATLGSLFFSEVIGYPPCVLCWYQRIAMYPLVIIFAVGSFSSDKTVFRYSFPLALIGWITALYHILLYNGIIPEEASPCVEGVSCSSVFINWFGFITIPLLSFTAFSLILTLLFLYKKKDCHEK